jgi:hypothetical protein
MFGVGMGGPETVCQSVECRGWRGACRRDRAVVVEMRPVVQDSGFRARRRTATRFLTAMRVCLGGDFAAAITPARSGAEPARFLVLGESGMPAAGRVLVLFLELFLEMCSLALVCGVLALLFDGRGASTRGLLALVGGYSTAVLGAGAIGWVLSRRNAHGPPPAWARVVGLHAGRWRTVQRTLRQVRDAVRSLGQANPLQMLAAFAGSVIHVLCKVAALPFSCIWAIAPSR